jgi:hypothetical protein
MLPFFVKIAPKPVENVKLRFSNDTTAGGAAIVLQVGDTITPGLLPSCVSRISQ